MSNSLSHTECDIVRTHGRQRTQAGSFKLRKILGRRRLDVGGLHSRLFWIICGIGPPEIRVSVRRPSFDHFCAEGRREELVAG